MFRSFSWLGGGQRWAGGVSPNRRSTRTWIRHGAIAIAGLTLTTISPRWSDACVGPPPPPFCGKTLVWSHAGPPVLLLPGGGTFSVAGLLFFDLVDFPAGSGICPSGPYGARVTLTVTCSPAGDGGGTITVPVTTGFTNVSVPVTLPPGPPRICTVSGTASMTLGDGMTLDASSESVLCLADPAPGNPSLPRLDLTLLGLPGSEIVRVHPGDQAGYLYRVVNNDPSETFSGTFEVEMLNTARMPFAGGPMPPGTGPFSVSDPVQGDNFPVGFEEDLFLGCVVIPPDPTDPQPATILRDILLEPGESIDVPVFSRPFGACADGSCNRGTVVVDGTFGAADPALACTGFVTAADTGAAPSYQWPDSGEVARATPTGPARITLSAKPKPEEDPVDIDFTATQVTVTVDGNPVVVPPIPFADTFDAERGRIQLQLPDTFNVDSLFDIVVRMDIELPPGQPIGIELVQLSLLPSAPTGFLRTAPAGLGRIRVDDFLDRVDSFFDLAYQASAVGIDNTGARRNLVLDQVAMDRLPDGSGFVTRLTGTVEPGPGSVLDALEIALDLRGFVSPEPQGTFLFEDGFESGNVSRWSSSTQ